MPLKLRTQNDHLQHNHQYMHHDGQRSYRKWDNKAINIGNRWNRGGAQIWANGQHHTQGYKTSPLNKNKSRKRNWVSIISNRKIKPSLTNFLMVTIHLTDLKITFLKQGSLLMMMKSFIANIWFYLFGVIDEGYSGRGCIGLIWLSSVYRLIRNFENTYIERKNWLIHYGGS